MPEPSRRKKLVLFSDGTGNSAAKAQKTNVWRMFQALDQTTSDQLAKYDDGVGTSRNKYLAMIGGAFGWGLKRNVLDLYKFLCRNYPNRIGRQDIDTAKLVRPDIYGFGFSRGSFTIRLLVDLIAKEGLVTFRSEEELNRNAAAAYRHYRSMNFPSYSPFVIVARKLRDAIFWLNDRIKGYRPYAEITEDMKAAGRAEVPIKFLGLWDTVDAYGMPIAELKHGIDKLLWPMLFDDFKLSPKVERACHALSLDDERLTFHPLLWNERAEVTEFKGKVPRGRITQVWFAGVHSNVGGGYPEDQLSLVSLEWMMGEAMASGLALDRKAVEEVSAAKSPYARLHDSRKGLASYYRYGLRRIEIEKDGEGAPILPIIHWSVVIRMASGSDRYSPVSLPNEFWVLAPDGELLAMEEARKPLKLDAAKNPRASAHVATNASAAIAAEKAKLKSAIHALARPDRQAVKLVWDTVFWRRCLYFLTITLTAALVAYRWLDGIFASAVKSLIGFIPVIGSALAQRWSDFLTRFDVSSRGPVASLVDALSGFIPGSGYAEPWVKKFEEHPVETALIVTAIALSLAGSSVLQMRIHDRARLAWHENYRSEYAEWLSQAQKGWRRGVLIAFVIAVVGFLLSFGVGAADSIKLELGIATGVLAALYGLGYLGRRRDTQNEKGAIQKSFALSLARRLRTSSLLRFIYRLLSEEVVPAAFALLIVVAAGVLANRALFDGFSAAGTFCKGTIDPKDPRTEIPGTKQGFTTSQICSPTGLKLEAGHRYRVTLSTPGDWFDRTVHTDIAGFPAGNFNFLISTPLKRWWGQNWFKPIARIGELGNDEYVLQPSDPFEPYSYPSCQEIDRATERLSAKISDDAAQKLSQCAPVPNERKSVIAEIKAQTTGELFLYVNDAVLMPPGLSDWFYKNNTGTGSVSVERVLSQAKSN